MAGTSGGVLEELDGGGARRLRLRLTLFLSPAGATPPSSFLSPPESLIHLETEEMAGGKGSR